MVGNKVRKKVKNIEKVLKAREGGKKGGVSGRKKINIMRYLFHPSHNDKVQKV
jgi:hypothetical protein